MILKTSCLQIHAQLRISIKIKSINKKNSGFRGCMETRMILKGFDLCYPLHPSASADREHKPWP